MLNLRLAAKPIESRQLSKAESDRIRDQIRLVDRRSSRPWKWSQAAIDVQKAKSRRGRNTRRKFSN